MVVETTARAPSSSAWAVGGVGGLGLGVEGCVGNPLGVAKPAGTSDPPGGVSKGMSTVRVDCLDAGEEGELRKQR